MKFTNLKIAKDIMDGINLHCRLRTKRRWGKREQGRSSRGEGCPGFRCGPHECPETECEVKWVKGHKEEQRQKIILLRTKLCREGVDEEPNCTRRM